LLGFVLFFPGGIVSDISNFSNCFRKFSIAPFFEPIRTENQIEPFNRDNFQKFWTNNYAFQNQSFKNSLNLNDSYDFLTPNFLSSFFQNKLYFEKSGIPFFEKEIQHTSSEFLQKQKPLNMFDFSYTNNRSLENAFSLEKLESTEFEKLSNFYLEKFNKIFVSFLLDRINNEFIQKFIVQKNFEQELFKKSIESKRNVLNWQWFTVKTTPFFEPKNNMNFQNFDGILHQKKNSFYFGQNDMPQTIFNLHQSSPFKIPRKAQFFNNIFHQNFLLLQKNKNLTFQSAPIFHFGNSRSFFNEFEKNLFFSPNFFQNL